jgi:MFS family permease
MGSHSPAESKLDPGKTEEEAINRGEDALSINNAWPTADDEDLERAISNANPGVEDKSPTNADDEKQPATLSRIFTNRSATSRSSQRDPGPPPDGGLQAWTQVLMLHLTIFSTFGYTTAFGSFQTYYQTTLGVSQSTISWLGSVQLFLLFFIGAFAGRALDAGLFRPVYTAGSIMQLLGVFTTSVATKYWQLFLCQALCMGLANGLHFTPAMGLAATYFVKKRSLVLGIGALGSCTGGLVFPIIIQQLLPRIGFGWTLRVIAFIMVTTNAITLAFYRTRLPPRKTGPLVEWAALKEPPYVLYCIASFLFFWALYFAFFFVGSYAKDRLHMSYQDSVNLLLTMVCMGFVWRLVPNYLADKFGAVNAIVPFTFVCSVMMFAWIGVKSLPKLYVFAAIYGCGSAGIQSMYPATLASLTSDLSKAGTRMGMGFTLVSFACLTGAPLAGALIERNGGDYLYAQM